MTDAPQLGLLFLGRKRPGFDPEWGQRMAERLRRVMADRSAHVFEPAASIVDSASLGQALAECRANGVDVPIVLQTTMADGRMAPTFHQLWSDPVVLWATPENQDGDMISSCSLVGLHTWTGILRTLRHPFEIVMGDPDDPDTLAALERAVRVASAAARIRRARAGLVGGVAPGFLSMSADFATLQTALGVQLQQFSLVEFIERARELPDDVVNRDAEIVRAMAPLKDFEAEDLSRASRLYLAMKGMMDEEALDALAVRCWPELPNVVGQWPYIGMSRLAEEGRAIALEGDIDGGLTCLIGRLLGFEKAYLSDWLENDAETMTLWHGGVAPVSFAPSVGAPGGPMLARHFNNRMPAVVEMTLAAGRPITLARLWRCEGAYRMTAWAAETVEPRRRLMGTNGLARLADRSPREWFEMLCHEGMPHHVAVFPGHGADLLKRFARAMRIGWVG